jgi:tetratricopeptide (TPR) repeat protein
MTRRFVSTAALVALAVVLLGFSPGGSRPELRLLPGLGGFGRAVSSQNPEAKRHFDQGLTLYYGFKHDEATTSFEEAARLEPALAMAYWGRALAEGPNYNVPFMDDETARDAFENAQKALSMAETASPVERSLIQALATRYTWPQPADRKSLDEAYAGAMRQAWLAFPGDPDVGTLYAEAMMDLRPWDLWTSDGKAQPGTNEIVEVLESVLRVAPNHPGANHFLIHALEQSPDPGRALQAAERLRTMLPGIGHMLHMPSHIDIRLGHYGEAVAANQKAIAADIRYPERKERHGYYTVYRAHDYHFLAYAAMFAGRRDLASEAAEGIVALLPPDTVRKLPDFLDAFLAIPYHVMVRFGQWQKILDTPAPPQDLKVTTAFYRYARTLAFSALGRVEEGQKELDALKLACEEVPESALVGQNPARVVLQIARPMAEGELEYRKGHYDTAFALLREAVRRDDTLRYDEPWGWMQPVRHALGALLLEQNRLAEAEAVYREDLGLHPGNGWALVGLATAQRKAGDVQAAAFNEALFKTAWADADVSTRVSCYCATRSGL